MQQKILVELVAKIMGFYLHCTYNNIKNPKNHCKSFSTCLFLVFFPEFGRKNWQTWKPLKTWARSNSNKKQYMRGGPASHIDQGRRSRFPARVLLRPGRRNESARADRRVMRKKTGASTILKEIEENRDFELFSSSGHFSQSFWC